MRTKAILIGLAVLVSGVAAFAVSHAGSKGQSYQWCYCNFNACLGGKSKSCMTIDQCQATDADTYADQVGNRKALMVIDSHRFCINPMAGIMRGGH